MDGRFNEFEQAFKAETERLKNAKPPEHKEQRHEQAEVKRNDSVTSYHDETDSISCSQFKTFIASPMEYAATWIFETMPKRESTKAMDLGTILHAMLLEKKNTREVMRAYPDSCLKSNGSINPVPARAFEESILPAIAVKDVLFDTVETIVEAAMSSPLGEVLKLDAHFERRIDAEIEGVQCRCKPDIHSITDDVVAIWDLKCTERVRPSDWWRTARGLKYFVQDAFYSLVAEAKYGPPAGFRFWALEVANPFRVQPYMYDERSREIAQEYVRGKLREFKQRQESGDWSDRWDMIGTITAWDVETNDDGELVTMDEE